MSNTDISQLAGESLAEGAFPSERQTQFRLFFSPEAHSAIHAHGSEDTSVEICGVLVGQWQKDADGPFAAVTEMIRCDDATQGQAEVTFTHESWNHINAEMDSKYQDLRIVGWYHTHPDFGIFLSDRDVFIQEHFFGGPGQVALVVDPIRKLEGVFEWRNGKPTLMDHYWIGDRIESVSASRTQETTRLVNRERAAGESVGAATAAAAGGPPQRDGLSSATTMLSWLCLFLLGWLLAGMSGNAQAYQSWAIERYGLWNIMQIGRNDEIRLVRADLDKIADAVTEMSSEHVSVASDVAGDDEDAKKAVKDLRDSWRKARERIAVSQRNLERIENLYALTPEQQELAMAVVVDQLHRLRSTDLRMTLPIPVPEKVHQMIVNDIMAKQRPPQSGDGKDAEGADGGPQPEPEGTPKRSGPAGPPSPEGSGSE